MASSAGYSAAPNGECRGRSEPAVVSLAQLEGAMCVKISGSVVLTAVLTRSSTHVLNSSFFHVAELDEEEVESAAQLRNRVQSGLLRTVARCVIMWLQRQLCHHMTLPTPFLRTSSRFDYYPLRLSSLQAR